MNPAILISFMPEKVTHAALTGFQAVYKLVKTDGLSRLVAVVTLLLILGSITGYITFPWQDIKASVKADVHAEGQEIIKGVTAAQAPEQRESLQVQKETRQATIQLCKIMARANK